MATNKNALKRYIIIDRCIRNTMSPFPSREKLWEKINYEMGPFIGISIETIDKDLKALRDEHNAPIVYNITKQGYYYTDKNYSFKNSISDEDLWVLDFAVAAINIYGHSHVNEKFLNITSRLNNGSNHSRKNESLLYHPIQIEGSTTQNGYQWLFDLYLYINQNQTVKIEYLPFDRAPKKHILSPYLLKQFKNRWYLVGLSHEKNRTLIFALDRVFKMSKVNDVYKIDPSFNIEVYFKHSYGVHHSYENPPEKVQLLFSKRLRPYIDSLPLHQTQIVLSDNENGYLIEIEVYCKGNYDFLAKVLSYGDDVQVISPYHLKEIILNKANATLELYI